MTETHKAAVEALEKLAGMMPDKPTAITFDKGWEIIDCVQDDVLQHIPEIIRTLQQPSSVEVTVEKKQYYRSREFYIEYFASVLCRMDDLDPKRWREGSETFEWTEFEQHAECILDAILQDFPSALRITRAAATDGVE